MSGMRKNASASSGSYGRISNAMCSPYSRRRLYRALRVPGTVHWPRRPPVPRSAPHANPAEIFPFEAGAVPADDRAYFEMLSWFVFGAGLNFRLLRAKWPHFLEAFENFDVPTVADYGEPD